MAIKVAINGFGRIGRPFLRMAFGDPRIEVVALNTRANPATMAHLLKYDSTHGRYAREVSSDAEHLIIDGHKIPAFSYAEPGQLPWKEFGVDIVMENSGKFKTREALQPHLDAGAKKVLLSAPAKNEDITLVYGVNHEQYDGAKHHIVSNASCTTNCLAPPLKVVDAEFGIIKGLMTTVHAYTNDQQILDKSHKDLRRARSAAVSIIPTTTGAARAVGLVLPQLQGKLNGFALRVPTPNVSLVDVTLELARETTAEELNAALKRAAEGELRGVLGYSEEPLVSIDYNGEDCSGVVDALSTMVIGGNLAKLVIWYDNEWGYTRRIMDILCYMGERL